MSGGSVRTKLFLDTEIWISYNFYMLEKNILFIFSAIKKPKSRCHWTVHFKMFNGSFYVTWISTQWKKRKIEPFYLCTIQKLTAGQICPSLIQSVIQSSLNLGVTMFGEPMKQTMPVMEMTFSTQYCIVNNNFYYIWARTSRFRCQRCKKEI